MVRINPPLNPAIRNLINEGSLFRRETTDFQEDMTAETEMHDSSPESASQTLREKIQGTISKVALGDTLEQPEN